MKRIIILAVVLFVAVTFNAEAKRHYNGVGGYFYSQLAPYGSWIEVDYGVIVWRPTIIRVNWSPYQMGNWIWTYDGWYWDSYEPFGFITYHYGRWYYDDYYGWLWYPDYEWAPAWVEWRYDNNYIGWAPLHPYAVFSVSVGIYFSTAYYTPYYHWNFVTYGNFCDPYVYNYYVAPGYKYRIHSGTKYRHNFVYYNGRIQNRGVDVKYVRDRSGKEIKQRDLIRVSDSRDLNRDSYKNRDEIRTLEMNRDELLRNDLGRMEIKRENRKTSVDMDKVKIGRTEILSSDNRNNKTREKTIDSKTVQTRNNVNDPVERVIDKNKSQNSRNTDLNEKKKNAKIESTQRETIKTKNSVDTQKENNEISVRNENQKRRQSQSNSNESVKQNRQKQEQSSQVKKENNKSKNDDRISQNNTRIQKNNNDQKNRSNEIKQNESRTNTKEKSKERKR